MNETIQKFEYPATLIREYPRWVVLLRPKQITAGCLVLACKEAAASMPEVSTDAFAELAIVTKELEAALKKAFHFDKINYILLMMVDKHVHFHVIPRYSSPRDVVGVQMDDPGWPKHPDMNRVIALTSEQFGKLLSELKRSWPQ